jgi:hypothetical protein
MCGDVSEWNKDSRIKRMYAVEPFAKEESVGTFAKYLFDNMVVLWPDGMWQWSRPLSVVEERLKSDRARRYRHKAV